MMIWSSKTARTLLLSFRYSMVTIDSIHMIYSEVVVVWRDWIPRDRCSQLHFRYNIDTEKDNILDKQLHRNKTILSLK